MLFFFALFFAAVQSSMPSFHAKMQSKLRTEAMGADTIVWLAVSAAATKQPSGLFFQGQKQNNSPFSHVLFFTPCCLMCICPKHFLQIGKRLRRTCRSPPLDPRRRRRRSSWLRWRSWPSSSSPNDLICLTKHS